MSPQELTASLLAVLEGLRLTAYQDSGGVWTIGFGHTKDVKEGDVCTREQAADWLAEDANPLFALVVGKSATEQAGYVSFGYNCGFHALQLVLAGSAQMHNFVHDRHGNVLPGLVSRRALEQGLIDV